MKLFTKPQYQKLLKNGANWNQDHAPVVKWFISDGSATWLISEIDPEEPDIAFGLCDLGLGFPELGAVSIAEIPEHSRQIWPAGRAGPVLYGSFSSLGLCGSGQPPRVHHGS